MGFKEFFKALLGMDDPEAMRKARKATRQEPHEVRADGATSVQRIIIVTPSQKFRLHFQEHLKPVVEALGYAYDDQLKKGSAVGSRIVIFDGRPEADAKLHNTYDTILRIKKAKGKTDDIICVIGQRKDYKRYPRGTYARVLFFCVEGEDPTHCEPDLTLNGLETIEGPTLYNIADMPGVIEAKIKEYSGGLKL